MEPNKAKIYLIEFYNSVDKSLLNKYKFALEANKVSELKALITDNLLSKKQIEPTTKLTLKDNDDFELASDDEVAVVLPDCKVKIYREDVTQSSVVNPPQVAPALATIPSKNTQDSHLAMTNNILNLSQFVVPNIPAECKNILSIHCPQIRKSAINIPFEPVDHTFLTFSDFIIQKLGLEAGLRAIIYSKYGEPYLFNLDLMHTPLPKLNLQVAHYIIFTRSPSSMDTPVVQPPEISAAVSFVTVTLGANKMKLEIDLNNTLEVLKYRVFKLTSIHPLNQILKFVNNPLVNPLEILKTYGIVNESILQLSFKNISNLYPSTFADKFYYKDIAHIRTQDQLSISTLRSNLLILVSHLTQVHKKAFPAYLRLLTMDMPLVFSFKSILEGKFMGQAHRIALEEGLFTAIIDYLKKCKPAPDTLQFKDVFTHVREFFSFIIEGLTTIKDFEPIKACEQSVQISRNCYFTLKPIVSPYLIKLDTGERVVVDRDLFEEQILKGFKFDLLKNPKKEDLVKSLELCQAYDIFLRNLIDNPSITTLFWYGFSTNLPALTVPALAESNKYISKIDSYDNLKVHQPLEVKNKTTVYLLLITKQNKLMVFVSRNKDISKPYNIFNVLTGTEEAVNFDLMGANVKTENVEEVVDVSNLKAVITREPQQAIVVLFDVSGSMGGGFFNQNSLQRIGAVKSFFQAFAFRTIAYNLEHVVSLIFFDHTIETNCGFTEAIYDFNRLIAKAAPRGSTLLYDAIVRGVEQLKKFSKLYPNCALRILALTDGEDTGSKNSILETAKAVVANKITMDSFAVGANCEGLKIVTKATGGKCYLTRNLEESLKLFEQETVLSVRARKIQPISPHVDIETLVDRAKTLPFDLVGDIHAFKMPEVSKPGVSAKEMLKTMEGQEEMKKISGSSSLKRIARQIQLYSSNPHPFVSIYPCANINIWKILLLGPKETPYQNGLFLLYVQFPGDFPFRAPEVRFITPIYHCNMNAQGRICHSVFDRNYSPALTFRQIMDCVYGLILTPEPEDPLDNVVASFYLSDFKTYFANAQKATKENASLPTERIVDELFGKITDDVERKQRENQIDDWIKLAKSCN